MVQTFKGVPARRVLCGQSAEGKSTIVSDGPTTRWLSTPAMTVCDIWETEALPVAFTQEPCEGKVVLDPARGGFIYRVTTFMPDDSFDPAEMAKLVEGMGGAMQQGDKPGLHRSDTVDMVTVMSGECYCVLEEGEVHLTPGDTVILRGSVHAWSNRSTQPCMVASLMMGAG